MIKKIVLVILIGTAIISVGMAAGVIESEKENNRGVLMSGNIIVAGGFIAGLGLLAIIGYVLYQVMSIIHV